MSISARRFLDRLAERGLLEDQVIDELRKHVESSLFEVPVDAVAKLLVDRGQLTPFQANKLVSEITLAEEEAAAPAAEKAPTKAPEKPADKPAPPATAPTKPTAAKPATDKPTAPPPPPPSDSDDLALADLGDGFTPSSATKKEPPKPKEEPPAAKTPAAPAKKLETPAKKPETPAAKSSAPAKKAPEPAKKAPESAPSAKEPVDGLTLLDDAAEAPAKTEPAKPTSKTPAKSSSKPATKPAAKSSAPAGLEPLPPSATPSEGLTPLGDQGLAPLNELGALDRGLSALPGGGDPFGAGAMGLDGGGLMPGMPAPAAPAKGFKKVGTRGWDSPLFLIVGGLVLILIIGTPFLWYVLTRGTAAEMFEAAEADYKGQSYTQAISKYDKYLKTYPDDPNVSLARVRRGLAMIRSLVEGSSDMRQGLDRTKEVLPQISSEERFADARTELAGILPTIAGGLAKQAKEAGTGEKAKELVKLANEAMELVDEPNYISSQLRPPIQATVDGIKRTILEAQRNIRQADQLVASLQEMDAALAKNDTTGAFEIRRKLLKEFPGLETNEQLVAIVLRVAAAERDQVKVESREVSAATEDHPQAPDVRRVILAYRRGDPVEGVAGQVAFVLARGSVYGLDVATGKILWRRFVGFETFAHPQPVARQAGADVLISDMLHQEVARLEAKTGQLVWRLPIDDRFAPPVIWGDRVFITTLKGQVFEADLATGKSSRVAQLPQAATVEMGGSSQLPHSYQAGAHSNLYVLAQDSLACKEVFYLGHRQGTVAVPPVVAVNHLFVAENAGADYALIHVLAVDEAGLHLERPADQEPIRVPGNVISPLVQVRNRILVTTDRASLLVLEVDPTNKRKPVKTIAQRLGADTQPLPSQVVAEGAQLWIGNDRFMAFDIQASREQLAPKWVKHEQEWFVAPLQKFGSVLVHVRRRRGSLGVTVAAAKPETGNLLWQIDLGSPLAYVGTDAEKSNQVVAISGQGELFRLTKEAIEAGQLDQPTETAEVAGSATTFALTAAWPVDERRVVLVSDTEPGTAVLFDPSRTGDELAVIRLDVGGATINSTPVPFAGGLAVTTDTGSIFWLAADTGKNLGLPFQPKLGPGERIQWNRPAVLASGRELVACDGRQKVYRVTVKDQPNAHLALAGEANVPEPLLGALATGGAAAFGVSRGASADIVRVFPLPGMTPPQELALQGRVLQGLWSTADAAYLVSDKEGLVALGAGTEPKWTLALPGGSLAGAPRTENGTLVVTTLNGTILRVAADSGQVQGKLEPNEPLGGTPTPLASRLLVPGADGVLYATPAVSSGTQ